MIRRGFAFAAVLLATSAITAPAGAATSPGAPQGNVTPVTTQTSRVAVVAQSAPVDGRVALLLQNGTGTPARIDLVTALATRADGGMVTRATTTAAYPQVLGPGGQALAAVTFPKNTRPDAKIEARVRSTGVSASRIARALSVGGFVLSPPLTGNVAQTLQTTVTNTTSSWTARKPQVAVMCFGEASLPSTFAKTRVDARRVAPGASVPVTVPLTSLCPTYLVAARAT